MLDFKQNERISYVVFNHHWRRGIAEEVVTRLIKFGIKDLKLNRLEADILPNNKASRNLAKKLGMKYEGSRKEAIFMEGRWQDHVVYAITASMLGIKNRKPIIRTPSFPSEVPLG